MLHKVGEAVLPMGLSASISLPGWCEAIYNLDAVVAALHNARFGGTSKGPGKLGLVGVKLQCTPNNLCKQMSTPQVIAYQLNKLWLTLKHPIGDSQNLCIQGENPGMKTGHTGWNCK